MSYHGTFPTTASVYEPSQATDENSTFFVQPYYLPESNSWGVASKIPDDKQNETAADMVIEDALDLNGGCAPGSPEEWQALVTQAVEDLYTHEYHEDGPVNIVSLPIRTYAYPKDPVSYCEARKNRARCWATSRGILYAGVRQDGTCMTWCPSVDQVPSSYTGQYTLGKHFKEIQARAGLKPGSLGLQTYWELPSLTAKSNFITTRLLHEANEVMRTGGHGVTVDVSATTLPGTMVSSQTS